MAKSAKKKNKNVALNANTKEIITLNTLLWPNWTKTEQILKTTEDHSFHCFCRNCLIKDVGVWGDAIRRFALFTVNLFYSIISVDF